MASNSVAVLRTDVANLASVLAGLRRAGADAHILDNAQDVWRADRLVLPGVGSFEAAITELRLRGLIEPLRQRIRAGRSTLAICLGLQLLGSGSEESPSVQGLGVFPERATKFGPAARVPQLGWNLVSADPASRFLRSGYAYFANSFRLVQAPAGWRAAWSGHDGQFVAAMERGNVVACQFHPELSGEWGMALLNRWVLATPTEATAC